MATQTTAWVARGIALAIVGLLIGVAIGYFVYPAVNPAPTQPQTTGLPSVIKIGAILSLSGDLAPYGQTQRAALLIAQQDINNWLSMVRPGVQVQFVIEDTATKPDQALSKLQSLAAQGIKFFIGPSTSAELKNIMGYAQSNQLILISPSSDSQELAIPKPFVYRTDPPVLFQAYAVARAMWEAGIRYIIIVGRHDSWGDSLSQAVAARWQQLGGQFEMIQYPPATTDFTAIVADLNNRIAAAIQTYGASKVAVNLNSFDEGALLMHAAASYSTLGNVRWYGSDAIIGSPKFVNDTTVAQFSVKTKFISPIFTATYTNITQHVKQFIISQLGRPPDDFAYAAYDGAWLLVKAIVEVNAYDSVKVNQILPQVAASFFGASGWTILDKNNDRAAADYAFWAIVNQNGQYNWVVVGTWSFASDSVTFLPGYEAFG